jgi:hypothetical protein
MQRIALAIAIATLAWSTAPAEVFVTKDAQGRLIYTDRPETLPAEKVNVATKQTDVVEVQSRYAEQMKAYAEADKASSEGAKRAAEAKQAKQLTAEDKAKRCQEARTRYQNVMNARRLYESGANPDERRYLDSSEIDAARASAKKVMDEFCAGM